MCQTQQALLVPAPKEKKKTGMKGEGGRERDGGEEEKEEKLRQKKRVCLGFKAITGSRDFWNGKGKPTGIDFLSIFQVILFS